jgi:hypothetical protein
MELQLASSELVLEWVHPQFHPPFTAGESPSSMFDEHAPG